LLTVLLPVPIPDASLEPVACLKIRQGRFELQKHFAIPEACQVAKNQESAVDLKVRPCTSTASSQDPGTMSLHCLVERRQAQ